jgi:hypothetical protein
MSGYDFAHAHPFLVFCLIGAFVFVVREIRYMVRRPEDDDLEEAPGVPIPPVGHDAADHDACQPATCDFKALLERVFPDSTLEKNNPFCDTCGHLTRRVHTYFRCDHCGNRMGTS